MKAAGRSSPTIVSLARTPRAVDLVFLLLLPVADGGRLNALASVARKLRKSETTAALPNASDGVELHHTIVAEWPRRDAEKARHGSNSASLIS
ncbi:MAG: hypothetical protein ACJ8D9_03220 [Xanthobacteraceae bacterium]